MIFCPQGNIKPFLAKISTQISGAWWRIVHSAPGCHTTVVDDEFAAGTNTRVVECGKDPEICQPHLAGESGRLRKLIVVCVDSLLSEFPFLFSGFAVAGAGFLRQVLPLPIMPRRILIAPDKFKGSLSAPEVAAAIAGGIRRKDPTAQLDICPIADGGEGFMQTLFTAMAGRWTECPAVDALNRPISSRYVLADTADGPVAILEMAETAGMWRISANERNPLLASTRGVGMQIADAITRHRVKSIILGLGGSATNDGGAGMAAALGVRFLDESGRLIDPVPANFGSIRTVDAGRCLVLPEITAACDVDNPLLGERGATAVFSPQKGSTEATRPVLESALAHLARISGGDGAALRPGAGAAGGLGFGLLHFGNARLVSGFELIAGLTNLEARVRAADLVITGEGSIDHQSLSGKGPVALARMAARHSIPVTGFCGIADREARESGVFNALHALADTGLPLDELISRAGPLLGDCVARSHPAPS